MRKTLTWPYQDLMQTRKNNRPINIQMYSKNQLDNSLDYVNFEDTHGAAVSEVVFI